MEEKIYHCPNPKCEKCIALAYKRDECISVAFHFPSTIEPPRRPHTVRLLAERRCPKCKKDFIVECYASISDILRWLIFQDPDAIARNLFEHSPDLITKLRQDKKFMQLINDETYDK